MPTLHLNQKMARYIESLIHWQIVNITDDDHDQYHDGLIKARDSLRRQLR